MNVRETDGVEASANPRSSLVCGAGLVGGAGVSLLAYRIVSERLIDDGTFVAGSNYPGNGRDEILRYGPWVLIAAALVLLLLALRRPGHAEARFGIGAFVLAAGFVWFLLSSIDMHVLGIYDWPEGGSHLLEDLVYHGGGMIVAAVGWVMLFPNGLRPPDRG